MPCRFNMDEDTKHRARQLIIASSVQHSWLNVLQLPFFGRDQQSDSEGLLAGSDGMNCISRVFAYRFGKGGVGRIVGKW